MEKTNYIDEILEEFDKEFPKIMEINHSIERREKIKTFVKQKLQEVEQKKVEEIRKELRNLNWTIDEGRFGNILNDEQIFGMKSLKNEKENT